jgi:hypothetical protein
VNGALSDPLRLNKEAITEALMALLLPLRPVFLLSRPASLDSGELLGGGTLEEALGSWDIG